MIYLLELNLVIKIFNIKVILLYIQIFILITLIVIN